jgi:hypothetical protein
MRYSVQDIAALALAGDLRLDSAQALVVRDYLE